MGIGRIGKHLIEHRWRAWRLFPQRVLDAIEKYESGLAAVAVGAGVAVAVTGRPVVAGAVPALAVLVTEPVAEGAADRPAVPELPVPHAVSAAATATPAASRAGTAREKPAPPG